MFILSHFLNLEPYHFQFPDSQSIKTLYSRLFYFFIFFSCYYFFPILSQIQHHPSSKTLLSLWQTCRNLSFKSQIVVVDAHWSRCGVMSKPQNVAAIISLSFSFCSCACFVLVDLGTKMWNIYWWNLLNFFLLFLVLIHMDERLIRFVRIILF